MRSKKSGSLYLKGFDTMEQFREEREEYLDDCNNQRIKSKLKGLPLPNTGSKPLKENRECFFTVQLFGVSSRKELVQLPRPFERSPVSEGRMSGRWR